MLQVFEDERYSDESWTVLTKDHPHPASCSTSCDDVPVKSTVRILPPHMDRNRFHQTRLDYFQINYPVHTTIFYLGPGYLLISSGVVRVMRSQRCSTLHTVSTLPSTFTFFPARLGLAQPIPPLSHLWFESSTTNFASHAFRPYR